MATINFKKGVSAFLAVIAACVLYLVIYFWPAYLVWCLLAPKFAARITYGEDMKRNFPTFYKVIGRLNGWIPAMLPFFWKKYFMEQRGIRNYSDKAQVKYYLNFRRYEDTVRTMSNGAYKALWCSNKLKPTDFFNLNKRSDFKKIYGELSAQRQVKAYQTLGFIKLIALMSDEAVALLWDSSTPFYTPYREVIDAGCVLSDTQFYDLMSRNFKNLITLYVSKHTPTEDMIEQMLDREAAYESVIKMCIKKYGLSRKSVRKLEKLNLMNKYGDALGVFAQRTFLQRHDNPQEDAEKLEEFFKMKLHPEAQIALKPWQYEIFKKTGHDIDEKVLESFLEKENLAMLEIFFKINPDYKGSEMVTAMILANPKLLDLMMRIKAEKA